MLNCTVCGYPLPDVEWIKDRQLVLNEGSSYNGSDENYSIWDVIDSNNSCVTSVLTVDLLSYDDSGEYQCISYNTLFKQISSQTNVSIVDVQCKHNYYYYLAILT